MVEVLLSAPERMKGAGSVDMFPLFVVLFGLSMQVACLLLLPAWFVVARFGIRALPSAGESPIHRGVVCTPFRTTTTETETPQFGLCTPSERFGH